MSVIKGEGIARTDIESRFRGQTLSDVELLKATESTETIRILPNVNSSGSKLFSLGCRSSYSDLLTHGRLETSHPSHHGR